MLYFDKLIAMKNAKAKIGIVGYGLENKQFLQWLTKVINYPEDLIIIYDQNVNTTAQINYPLSNIITGSNYLNTLLTDNCVLIIKAPGIWSLHPKLEEFRKKSGRDTIISSLTFFIEKFRNIIVGVTGTKGKTTTSSLIKHLLDKNSNKAIHYCGNTTNVSPYQFWPINDKKNIEDTIKNCIFVIELSSFQLQDLGNTNISPSFSVITNYYVDHLDQHNNELEYWMAKDNIFKYQIDSDYLITSQNAFTNFETRKSLSKIKSKSITLSTEECKKISLQYNSPLDGAHNESNAAIAILASNIILAKERKTIKINDLKDFPTPKGRLEKVSAYTINNKKIIFINDNTATEPDAVCACLETLVNKDKLTILILGGKIKQGNYPKLVSKIKSNDSKDSPISEWMERGVYLKSSNLAVVACGQVGSLIRDNLCYADVKKTYLLKNFFNRDGAKIIKDLVTESQFSQIDVVLSPGGSSFDEYNNYLERDKDYLTFVDFFK